MEDNHMDPYPATCGRLAGCILTPGTILTVPILTHLPWIGAGAYPDQAMGLTEGVRV